MSRSVPSKMCIRLSAWSTSMLPVLDPHEQLDAAHAATVQAGKVAVVGVRGSVVARVVDDAPLVQQFLFGSEGIEGGGLRVGVGHVHYRGDPARCGCPAFAQDVGLLRQSRFAEVYVLVDDTRQQVAPRGIDGLRAGRCGGFALGGQRLYVPVAA